MAFNIYSMLRTDLLQYCMTNSTPGGRAFITLKEPNNLLCWKNVLFLWRVVRIAGSGTWSPPPVMWELLKLKFKLCVIFTQTFPVDHWWPLLISLQFGVTCLFEILFEISFERGRCKRILIHLDNENQTQSWCPPTGSHQGPAWTQSSSVLRY